MKNLTYLFLLVPFFAISQNYVDLLKIDHGTSQNMSFNESDTNTDISTLKLGLTLPIVLNKKTAFITGVSFSKNRLQLFPNGQNTSLYSTTLKFGFSKKLSDKWSSTVLVLPKIASDYKNITNKDLFFGGLALLKFKKSKNLQYTFGAYISSEVFSLFATPIFGIYYTSPNKRLEINALLPNSVDINYAIGKTNIGFDFSGVVRTYNLSRTNQSALRVEESPLEFSNYIQFKALQNRILLRAKVGYTTNEYAVYSENDNLDLMLPILRLGDNRTQLNPALKGGLFFRFEAIYRIHFKAS